MLFLEIIKFIIYSGLIVIISKYILVKALRAMAPIYVGNNIEQKWT